MTTAITKTSEKLNPEEGASALENTGLVQQGEKAREQAEQISKKTLAARASKSSGAFRTISEVADDLGVQQHVLRFWETKFSHVRPLKRGGGRRYYRPEDVDLLKRIHHLLYVEGYTIKGVQKLLKDVGKNQVLKGAGTSQVFMQNPILETPQENHKAPATVAAMAQPSQGRLPLLEPQNNRLTDRQRTLLETMLEELRELRNLIKPKKD